MRYLTFIFLLLISSVSFAEVCQHIVDGDKLVSALSKRNPKEVISLDKNKNFSNFQNNHFYFQNIQLLPCLNLTNECSFCEYFDAFTYLIHMLCIFLGLAEHKSTLTPPAPTAAGQAFLCNAVTPNSHIE